MIFFWVVKISNIFLGCLKFLIFFWGEGQMLGLSLRMQKNESISPGPKTDNVQKGQSIRLKETQNTERNKTDQTPSRPQPRTKLLEQQYLL